ncbi:hypothetical protein V1478_010565 [Vespula squamosa]|uniref:Uncharacterized protein n=1 Tax=Vespula squamosa TaxID=30214 RepID=A0ABD2AI43_VESSQ
MSSMGSERDINLRSECEQAITRWSRSFSLWLELAGVNDGLALFNSGFVVSVVNTNAVRWKRKMKEI